MLDIGQERSKVKTALAAEPGCIGDSKFGKSDLGRLQLEFQPHITAAQRRPVLDSNTHKRRNAG
jgi:hypothetical protein